MKKILATILAVSMIFVSIPTHALAKTDSKIPKVDIRILEQFETIEEKMEICEIDGVIYYFRDTPDKTITITKDLEGKFHIAYNNKETNELKIGKFDSEYSYLNMNLIEEFNNIENNLSFDDELFTNTISLDEMQYTTRESEYEIVARIDAKLKSIYGSPYSGRYISSLNESGVAAYLYGSMHFERYKYRSWVLNAGTSIGIVGSIISWPATTVAAIFATIGIGSGVIGIAKDYTSNEYVANAHWNKEVEVRNIYPYRAGKTIKGRVILGDIGAAYNKGKESKDWDFDDNNQLMSTGIKNYLQMQ